MNVEHTMKSCVELTPIESASAYVCGRRRGARGRRGALSHHRGDVLFSVHQEGESGRSCWTARTRAKTGKTPIDAGVLPTSPPRKKEWGTRHHAGIPPAIKSTRRGERNSGAPGPPVPRAAGVGELPLPPCAGIQATSPATAVAQNSRRQPRMQPLHDSRMFGQWT